MNLYIMRHAIAAEPEDGQEDSQRPLTEKGRAKLTKIVRGMNKLDLSFDVILTSPYLRAYQTAEVVAESFGVSKKQFVKSANLIPPGFADKLVQEINKKYWVDNLLVVGHEPFLSQWIGLLLAGDATLDVTMKKAGLCKLFVDKLVDNSRCAMLEWLVTPAQLAAL